MPTLNAEMVRDYMGQGEHNAANMLEWRVLYAVRERLLQEVGNDEADKVMRDMMKECRKQLTSVGIWVMGAPK